MMLLRELAHALWVDLIEAGTYIVIRERGIPQYTRSGRC